jgi:hypothetical protein
MCNLEETRKSHLTFCVNVMNEYQVHECRMNAKFYKNTEKRMNSLIIVEFDLKSISGQSPWVSANKVFFNPSTGLGLYCMLSDVCMERIVNYLSSSW